MKTSAPSSDLKTHDTSEFAIDSQLNVIIAERHPERLNVILQSLSKVKECVFTECSDQKDLLETAQKTRPDLILVSFETIQSDFVGILNTLRHHDPKRYIIVYLTAALEQTRNAVLMAGATECCLSSAENPQLLAETVKKALINISESVCSDGRLEVSVEELPQIMFTLDLDGRCIHINSAALNLLGYEKSELINAEFSLLIASTFQRENFDKFVRSPADHKSFEGLLALQTALGIEEDFQVSVTLMEGELLCGNAKKIGMGVNLTDWKNAQQSEIQCEMAEEDGAGDSAAINGIPLSLPGPYEGSMERLHNGYDKQLGRQGNFASYLEPPKSRTAQEGSAKVSIQEEEKMELKAATVPPPASVADQYCRQAAEDYGHGKYWSAVQHCKKALECREDFRIYHLMGKALAKHQGFRYDAMKALKKALNLNPDNILIQKDIADLYLSCENVALAEAHYRRILTSHPRDKYCAKKMREILHRNDFGKVVGRTIGKFFAPRKDQMNG